MEELIEILARFGGGKGGYPNDVVVRFLLPTFFWCTLAAVAIKEWTKTAEKKDLYIGVASLVGMGRELLMFTAEYGSLRGFVHFESLYYFYPPLEHAATMLSCIFIAYAFLNYLLQWDRIAVMYLIGASSITFFLYGIIAPNWIAQLGRTPGIAFGTFWGDMAFRIAASIFMAVVIAAFALAYKRNLYVPKALFLGFAFFFLDELLMIFNIATQERNVEIYAPIRHNLHIWAIPVFLGVYWAQMKKRIAEAETAVKSVFNFSPSMLAVIDTDGIIKKVSPACIDILGLNPEELQGRYLTELGIGKGLESKLSSLNSENNLNESNLKFEEEFKRDDGKILWLQWNIHPVKAEGLFYVTVSDITDQKHAAEEKNKLQAQLVHANKMEAVGHLAGGVAHDFNNILSAIYGYGHLLLKGTKDDDKYRFNIEQILNASERAARLTHSLLAFSRKQQLNPVPVDVNDIITNITDILSRIIGEDIEFNAILSADCMIINADYGQIEQVLMNLATNARDAMPAGGLLTIDSRLVELDDSFIKAHEFGKPGMYAMLSVADSGVGMDEETKNKIYEPFFTTKEVGKGTGLGLSMAYGIIKQHDGYLDVQSEEGVGTSFKIYLPVVHCQISGPGQETALPVEGGTETVLVAEDDEAVRTLSRNILEQYGYRVIEACDGEDAVQKFIDNKDRINLLLFDVVMPGINGKEAYARIQEVSPGIKVIFVSGYAADLIQKKGFLDSREHFISKPVMPNTLLQNIRVVLDSD